jgi:hypothetical protein
MSPILVTNEAAVHILVRTFERGVGEMAHQTRPAKAWYVLRDDLPDGEVLVPVETAEGTILAAREGHMSEQLLHTLNAAFAQIIGMGRWVPGGMAHQTRAAKAWYELRDDLPDGEVLVPVETAEGTILAVRKGHMSEQLVEAANATYEHLIGAGRWAPGGEE